MSVFNDFFVNFFYFHFELNFYIYINAKNLYNYVNIACYIHLDKTNNKLEFLKRIYNSGITA